MFIHKYSFDEIFANENRTFSAPDRCKIVTFWMRLASSLYFSTGQNPR